MDKEKLENAINRCWVEHHIGNKVLNDDEVKNFTPLPSENFKEGFIAGCEWRINSVWHDVSDEPDLKKLLLVEDIDGAYNLTYMTKIKKWKGFVQYEHYTRWAYVEDLLPTKTI